MKDWQTESLFTDLEDTTLKASEVLLSQRCAPQSYIHGSKLRRKILEDPKLQEALDAYESWRSDSLAVPSRDFKDIEKLVSLLNEYKNYVEPIFDGRKNSAQEVLQSTIIEEFFEYLFCQLDAVTGPNVLRKPEKGFLDLAFNPKSIRTLLSKPEYTIRGKDHDFVIGGALNISLQVEGGSPGSQDRIVIPSVAIECKRYLERNMLDECSGTAERVKRATPYCLFVVVAEYLKMDDSSPELSEIDEIYILRRQRNSDRLDQHFVPNPIYADLIWDIYQMVMKHLSKIWWDPESALTTGKLFNF